MRDAHDRTEIVVVEGGRHAVHKGHTSDIIAAMDAFLPNARTTPRFVDVRHGWSAAMRTVGSEMRYPLVKYHGSRKLLVGTSGRCR